MGTIKQGILGGFSGKVGTVIGGFWKGKSYMRGLTQSHHDARTSEQLEQRAKFSLMTKFVSMIQSVAKIGFKDSENGTTALNECMSYNIKNAITGTYPSYLVDYPNVIVSMGSLPNVEAAEVSDDGAGHVEFTWTNNTGDGEAADEDTVMVVIINKDQQKSRSIEAAAKRNNESFTFSNPTAWSGDTCHVYIATKSCKGSTTSRSEYLGTVVLS